ncbi:hypothetical protein PaecuDRAFT_3362 [Paenibacillus curdlanolyticus YK9]|uniref:Uncharacterized protein n=1 Tax=Paenibacillus curdlanolyticus YK9 TaxID=717606 RepID=E0ICH3_9BACL|nr:hypothetical protein PaecuDRAFT_3362 [Paenibacillus curdlanolyticus YK9]
MQAGENPLRKLFPFLLKVGYNIYDLVLVPGFNF